MRIWITLTKDNGDVFDESFKRVVEVPWRLNTVDVKHLPAMIATYTRQLLKVTLSDKTEEAKQLTSEEVEMVRKIAFKLGII